MSFVSWLRSLFSSSSDSDSHPQKVEKEASGGVTYETAVRTPDVGDRVVGKSGLRGKQISGRVEKVGYDSDGVPFVFIDTETNKIPVTSLTDVDTPRGKELPEHGMFDEDTPDHPAFGGDESTDEPEVDEETPDHEAFA